MHTSQSISMAPAKCLAVESKLYNEEEQLESEYQKGVMHLCENGIVKVPTKYILPFLDRPTSSNIEDGDPSNSTINLPVIDFTQLQGPNRSQVLISLAKACEEYGIFQLINHGIGREITDSMFDVSKRFFEQPFEDRDKYMSANMYSPVRYGTSFNQNKDTVFCWRDFLKLSCHPISQFSSFWPSSPADLREAVTEYSTQTRFLYLMLIEAILESLGVVKKAIEGDWDDGEDGINSMKDQLEEGNQMMVVNCYPSCPEPNLTLGMPPHSDYGLLTLLLQDEVKGLQIQHQQRWVTVDPIPNSFVVNVGDHLEIFSNGKYKSVLHRVLVNSSKSRVSVASLHSLPATTMVRPSPNLIDEANPRRYKDTDFATFLDYISSREPKSKNFLESRKLY